MSIHRQRTKSCVWKEKQKQIPSRCDIRLLLLIKNKIKKNVITMILYCYTVHYAPRCTYMYILYTLHCQYYSRR